MKEPFVSIILVNFNGLRYTIPCIESLNKMEYSQYELIVVDNGSKDGSLEALRKRHDIILIEAGSNVGFAKANNFGAARSSKKAEYIVLLNNDTIVTPPWLRELIAPFKNDKTLGAVMAKIHNKYEKNEYRFEGYGTMTALGYFSYAGLRNEKITDKDLPELFYASGCTLAYPKKLVSKPFDDDYFIYAEDTYCSWLLRLQGYHIKLVPKSIVYHEGSAVVKDFRQMSAFFTYLGERNRIMNMMIFYSWWSQIRLLPLGLIAAALNNLYDPKNFLNRLRAYGWIIAHPLRIGKKRKYVQRFRKVSDKHIFKYMSYKLFEEEHVSSGLFKKTLQALNAFAYGYCKWVGIKTKEMYSFKW